MEKHLNSSIKEVITAFPEVGKIPEEYNVGCVPCSVGSCLLMDKRNIDRCIQLKILNMEEGDV